MIDFNPQLYHALPAWAVSKLLRQPEQNTQLLLLTGVPRGLPMETLSGRCRVPAVGAIVFLRKQVRLAKTLEISRYLKKFLKPTHLRVEFRQRGMFFGKEFLMLVFSVLG